MGCDYGNYFIITPGKDYYECFDCGIENCDICLNADKCSRCKVGYYLVNQGTSCESSCPDAYSLIPGVGCIDCRKIKPGCVACSRDECRRCNDELVFDKINKICIPLNSCPDSYTTERFDGFSECSKCSIEYCIYFIFFIFFRQKV